MIIILLTSSGLSSASFSLSFFFFFFGVIKLILTISLDEIKGKLFICSTCIF
jgi:hypothetical protein